MRVSLRYGLAVFILFVVSISAVAVVRYIAADSRITRVDAVVVLSGSKTRLLEGIILMRELSADYLVIPWHIQPPWNKLKKKYHIQAALSSERVVYGKPGVDDEQIIARYGGTYLEAVKTLALSRRYGWHRLAITTEGYHLPRVKLAFYRVFRNTGIQLDFRASRFDTSLNIPFWRRWFRRQVWREIPKFVYGFIFY